MQDPSRQLALAPWPPDPHNGIRVWIRNRIHVGISFFAIGSSGMDPTSLTRRTPPGPARRAIPASSWGNPSGCLWGLSLIAYGISGSATWHPNLRCGERAPRGLRLGTWRASGCQDSERCQWEVLSESTFIVAEEKEKTILFPERSA